MILQLLRPQGGAGAILEYRGQPCGSLHSEAGGALEGALALLSAPPNSYCLQTTFSQSWVSWTKNSDNYDFTDKTLTSL